MRHPLSPDQAAAIELVRASRLVLVVGGPGTGKTTIISEIVDMDHGRVVLLAPTGPASQRLSGCSGAESFVIDKAFADAEFVRTHQDRIVVVDEAGMVNTDQVLKIFHRFKPRKLVLVGDPKQLPCIDGVPVLHNFLRIPRIPHAILTTRWRRHGRPISALDRAILTIGTDDFDWNVQDDTFRIVVCENRQTSTTKAVDDYKSRESQMLAFTNPTVDQLNAMTDDASRKHVRGTCRSGDRVVCTKNYYNGETSTPTVSNGECGTLGDKSVTYDGGFKDVGCRHTTFVPCRAMTVHKSQGNEYDVHGVVVASKFGGHDPPYAPLLYTAISRFKGSACIYIERANVQSVIYSRGFKEILDHELILQSS